MKDAAEGRPVHRIEFFSQGVLQAPDGRPVYAVALAATKDGRPDGRCMRPVSTGLADGSPVFAVSQYAKNLLLTPDGRPVYAVTLVDASGVEVPLDSPELVTNGDFASGTTGWTPSGGGTALSVVAGKLRVSLTGTSAGFGYQAVPVTPGQTYTVTWDALGGTVGSTLRIGDLQNQSQYLADTVLGTARSVNVTPTGSLLYLTLRTSGGVAGDYTEWDNISVKLAA